VSRAVTGGGRVRTPAAAMAAEPARSNRSGIGAERSPQRPDRGRDGRAAGVEVSLAQRWHPYLAAALDPASLARLSEAGLPPPGRECLALCAGASRVPGWLAGRVGRDDAVVATDLDVRHLRADPRVHRLRHDWARLPAGRFGLVWARLALAGLRHRDRLLQALAAALPAGGVLVVEEWYGWLDGLVLAAPTDRDRRLAACYWQLMGERILPGQHTDLTFAGRVHAGMRAAGLSVDTRVDTPVWPAGSPGALATAAQLHRHRAHLLTCGMTVGELSRLTGLLTDPGSQLVLRGHPLFSVIGRKPSHALASATRALTGK